jgi:hypothetical protein
MLIERGGVWNKLTKSKKLRGGDFVHVSLVRKKGHRWGIILLVEKKVGTRTVVPGEQYAQLPSPSAVAQPRFTTSHHGPSGSLSHADSGHLRWFSQVGSNLDIDHDHVGIHTQGSEERPSSKCLREAPLSHRLQDTRQLRSRAFQLSVLYP